MPKSEVTAITATISGSFRKHMPEIKRVADILASAGVCVLSPKSFRPSSEIKGFVILEGDNQPAKDLELSHIRLLQKSDFLYVVNPGGYVGASTSMEIGAAVAADIPVYSLEEPREFILGEFMKTADPASVLPALQRELSETSLVATSSLNRLQAYFRRAAVARGFTDETPADLILLLVEEVGELAKALRVESGLHYDPMSTLPSVELELADCLIYVLSIGNSLQVDLSDALRQKEEINRSRRWVTGNGSGLVR